MMSPVKGVDGVGAVCYDPVDREEAEMEMEKEDYLLGQAWEKTALQSITQQSGLFNKMDMASGLNTVDSVIDSTKLDLSATSTVDLTELFPDLTEILITNPDDEGVSSPLGEEGADLSTCAQSPAEAKGGFSGGRRGQLPSTSSCSEMSDYEEGLSPAELDSTLEHFFNTFANLEEFLVPAEETGPTSTVDAATVRSLIDNPTTTDNQSSLDNLLAVEDGSFALSTVNVTKRLKAENVEDEENTCQVAKKSRTSKNGAPRTTASPEELYRRRRVKNNKACQRARQSRKKRDNDLASTAKILEKENAELRAKIEELTEIAEISRRALVSVLAK
eukprot:XP_011661381.1 PREDICTED: uncharacterized protein LOC582157 isoform X2 [Strongylocentrotus purpuratus]